MPQDAPAMTNWRTSPFNRWAFRNVAALMPTAAIPVGPGAVMPLPAAPQTLDGFAVADADGSSLDLAGFLDATSSDGLVILRDGKVVYETYANGLEAHTPHILMSATKAVTGVMAGIARGLGKLDVEALVSDYVPEIADGPYAGATVRHLLDMRTGVRLNEDQQAAYDAATNWEPAGPSPTDLHAFYAGLQGPPATAHGGHFRYISANTDLLGWVIERATGQTFADLVSEHLWKPLGAEDAALITTDSHGAPRCTGGFNATVRDLARLGQLVLDRGQRDGAPVIPANWIADIETGGDHAAWAQGEWGKAFAFIGKSLRYSAGWYIVDDDPAHLFAMGIHGQNLFVDRTRRLVVAKLSSQASPIDYRALPLTHRGFTEIRRLLA